MMPQYCGSHDAERHLVVSEDIAMTRKRLINYCYKTLFCLFLSLGAVVGFAVAGTYYVSPTGTASWPACTNISTPCSVATAFANAVAGDVVYFRGGTYNVPAKNFGDTYTGYYQPSNSGTSGNPITFKAYPGEVPLFNGTAGGTGDHSTYATIFGVYRKSYIVFDGFSLQADNGSRMARMILYSDDPNDYSSSTVQPTHHITVKNMTFNGGTTVTSSTDNEEGLRIEDTDDITVQNCTFYNYRQTSNWHNTGAIKMYHVDRTTIENCEIYNCSSGIYDKSGSNGNIFRYNYIHDTYNAIYSPSNGYSNINGSVYHNLIVRSGGSAIEIASDGEGLVTNGWEIYNNTIYNSSPASGNLVIRKYGSGITYYNNIIVGTASDYGGAQVRHANCSITEMDYNQYGGNFNIRNEGTTYTNLTTWRDTGRDSHSLNSNPLFVNASGSLSRITDFAIALNSPCKGTGKGGVDMGADVNLVGPGNIGYIPNAPTGLKIIP